MDGRYNKLNKLSVGIFQRRDLRGSSYIETPSKLKHAKCGLVDIQTMINSVWKQTVCCIIRARKNKDYRVTVLERLKTIIIIKDNACPVRYEDIDIFQHVNKIWVVVCEIDDEETVVIS